MQTSPIVRALIEDLTTAAALGGDAAAEAAQRLAAALEGPLRLRLMEAMSEAAGELTHQLPGGHVEVRLAGSDVELVYVGESAEPAPTDDSLDARITLRLPDPLKRRIEAAAADEGISVNTWLVRALSKNVHQRRSVVGNRLTGFAKS
jgi:HicB family